MRITDLLNANSIALNVKAAGKEDVITQAVELMAKSGKITDTAAYKAEVFRREEEGTKSCIHG